MAVTAESESFSTEYKCTCEPPPKHHRLPQLCVLDVLAVDLCRSAIFNHISTGDLLRSECVCQLWRNSVNHYIRGSNRLTCTLHITSPRHVPSALPCRPLPLDDREPWFSRSLYKWGTRVISAPCTAKTFQDIVDLCPNLQELTFYGFPDPDLVRANVKRLTKLQRVTFKNRHSDDQDSEMVTDDNISIILQNNPIKELAIIENDYISGTFFHKLKNNLNSLRLKNCPKLNYSNILTAMDYLKYVTKLDLSCNNNDILKNAHLLINFMSDLEDLDLSGYGNVQLNGQLIEHGRLRSLRRLSFRKNENVNDTWLMVLAGGNKLVSFDVSYCKVTMSGLTQLCLTSRWISELAVAGNDAVSDEGVETLIRLCPNLEILDIQQCPLVSPRLVGYLARLMRRRRRRRLPVVRLRIYGTAVPGDGPMIPSLILDYAKYSQL